MGYQFKPEDDVFFAEILSASQYIEDADVDLTRPMTDDDGYDPDDPDDELNVVADLDDQSDV